MQIATVAALIVAHLKEISPEDVLFLRWLILSGEWVRDISTLQAWQKLFRVSAWYLH